LSEINFGGNDLAGGNFATQNLKNANFGAIDLTGANFREANLTNATFFGCLMGEFGCSAIYAKLTDADVTAADARGASGLPSWDATTDNLIRPDGHIDGLNLVAGGSLVVRDYDGGRTLINPRNGTPVSLPPIPITVDQHLTMAPGGTLRIVFEADAWNSTISFAPGIPVTLGGTLELTFADDVNLACQVGRSFDVFDWTGVTPTGAFAVDSPYAWDLSNLYTTGEVTLITVPEPHAMLLFSLALTALATIGRVRDSFGFK
jgi:hypothetical protein